MLDGSPTFRQVVAVGAAIVVAVAWVLVDHPLEGPVLLTLSADHGVHYTDALAIVPLAWAWCRVVRR
jgi:hypothetical protein